MEHKILEISANEVLLIRHTVMWPTKPIDYVRLPNDENGRHFGLYINDQLVSVISLFIENSLAQFRKFATLKKYQGKGYGTILLNEIMLIAQENKLSKIWCNARVEKSSFYEKFGMQITDKTFEKGGIIYVIMEKGF
ncbi:GNAT family N-acetyltransferase [Algoriphagus zhangzhouensis]|uniref:Acetyltransferase (GNAT) domain-containing protein n=1 Tax=Algoriphagus zhangzhouensis TaxID=1073327 RepID=A0A1M7ZCS0_9BACT|nr:GNAT family N-acetyltransferase [Algoriphagus zhangzhouensis]TDY45609.1 acetyltransferase (GNAT) family protein [Algoriphagus zhangzhouensis]SHO62632.1 Acetyltransferase (GNAT) domain-containing protein [Algoriphagus zhangzhouensis]